MHETVVAVFIRNRELLMEQRSRSRKVYAGFLMCPSGHIEEKESFSDTLKREMKEEMDIDVKRSTYLFTIEDADPFSGYEFRHNFMLIESFEGKTTKSNEAEKLSWMSYDELMSVELAPIVSKLVDKLHQKGLI
jgi:8-oxo-dGTP pyrophosphatase MutT (NUDIX family)